MFIFVLLYVLLRSVIVCTLHIHLIDFFLLFSSIVRGNIIRPVHC